MSKGIQEGIECCFPQSRKVTPANTIMIERPPRLSMEAPVEPTPPASFTLVAPIAPKPPIDPATTPLPDWVANYKPYEDDQQEVLQWAGYEKFYVDRDAEFKAYNNQLDAYEKLYARYERELEAYRRALEVHQQKGREHTQRMKQYMTEKARFDGLTSGGGGGMDGSGAGGGGAVDTASDAGSEPDEGSLLNALKTRIRTAFVEILGNSTEGKLGAWGGWVVGLWRMGMFTYFWVMVYRSSDPGPAGLQESVLVLAGCAFLGSSRMWDSDSAWHCIICAARGSK